MLTSCKAVKNMREEDRDTMRSELGKGFKRGLPTAPVDHMHDVLPAGSVTQFAGSSAVDEETGIDFFVRQAKRHGIMADSDASTATGGASSAGSTASGGAPSKTLSRAQVASMRNLAHTKAVKAVADVTSKVANELGKACVALMHSNDRDDDLFVQTLRERVDFSAAFLGKSVPKLEREVPLPAKDSGFINGELEIGKRISGARRQVSGVRVQGVICLSHLLNLLPGSSLDSLHNFCIPCW